MKTKDECLKKRGKRQKETIETLQKRASPADRYSGWTGVDHG
jgi:hypothetical protein